MFEYAPAPESRDLVKFQDSYGHFIGGKFTKPSDTYGKPSTLPPNRTLAQISARNCQGRRRGGQGGQIMPMRKPGASWMAPPGASTSTASPGSFRSAARELAVAETLNNGKPIKETRDADIPLAASWFFYYAGWADKLDYAGLGANPMPPTALPLRSFPGTSR